jgi:hypothetical protein
VEKDKKWSAEAFPGRGSLSFKPFSNSTHLWKRRENDAMGEGVLRWINRRLNDRKPHRRDRLDGRCMNGKPAGRLVGV